MLCRYVATFVAHAIALPAEFDSLRLYEEATERVSAILLKDPSELLADADRGAALAVLLLRGFVASPDPRDVEAKLAEQVATISENRKKAAQDAPFLVIIVEAEVQPDFAGSHNDQPSYSVYVDAIDKDHIRASARPKADRVLSAAIVASDAEPRFDRVGESIYLVNEDGRITYSMTFTAGAVSAAVRRLAPDLPESVAMYASASRKKGSPDLTTVYSLLRSAVDGRTEPLRAFISAWSALEIFTNKVFKTYEDIWFDELTKGRSVPDLSHLARMREVMKGKYRLVDTFTVVSVTLAPVDADADIADFADLKNLRDELFHGGSLNESALPAHRALALVRKYIRLHLAAAV